MSAYYGTTAARSDDVFVWAGPAPMSIPRDVDAAGAVIVPLLIPENGISLVSHTISTTVSAVPVTATGEVLLMELYLYVPIAIHLFGRFRVRVPWEITVAGNVGAVGRITADVRRRRDSTISVIPGVAVYNGQLRALDAVTRYTENSMVVQVPRATGRFTEGDDLVLRLALNVTTAMAGGSMVTAIIHHDPSVAADRLTLETDWPLPEVDLSMPPVRQ